jgi:hypothetical protein
MWFRTTPEEELRIHNPLAKTRRFKCTICEEILNTDPICHGTVTNGVHGIRVRCNGIFYEIGDDVK